MVDHHRTYQSEAEQYDELVSFEDYQGNLLPAIQSVTPLSDKAVLDLGAGTGRVTRLLQPCVRTIMAFDFAYAMIHAARWKSSSYDSGRAGFGVGDNRFIPLADHSVDVITSGWSICYLYDWFRDSWQDQLDKTFREMHRVIRPGGKVVIIETQGTGFETPHPPEHIGQYFAYLGKTGFEYQWIRTDYQFPNLETAIRISRFFFGDELARKVEEEKWCILPECTGIWWKTFD